jgi:GNAT superfamily N-acetyltransferase
MDAAISFDRDLAGIEWAAVKADLSADGFDNGRTPEELQRSFVASHATVVARHGDRVVGTARILADGVCNAYLVDVWTASPHRRTGIGSTMVKLILETVPGHHVGLFTTDHVDFYRGLGFEEETTGMSLVVGSWLNREHPRAVRKQA